MTYFNITFDQHHYSIQETRSKTRKRHNAIDILEKIEKALKENLKYSSTFPAGHSLHKMKKAKAFRHLQAKASEIHRSYIKKQSKLCWLWRKIFSKKKKVDAIYKRITDLAPRIKNALPILHNDGISIDELKSLRQVNARADLALKDAARKLGYKGKKIGKARRYLKILSNHLRTLSQQDWKYGVNGSSLFKNLIVYDHGKISIEKSINRLKQLSIDDLARLFAQNIPLQHLKKAILTPQISTRQTFVGLEAANQALYVAVKNREFEVVQFLLLHGANANFSDYDIYSTDRSSTLLALSIKQKTFRITHLLLQAKAAIVPGLLHEAARRANNHKNIKLLLKHGENVNQLDNNGDPAIYCAINHKNLTNVRTLIKGGADLGSASKSGRTVLKCALACSTPKIIKLLLEHGADPNYDGCDGSPLHFAVKHNSPEIIKLLVQYGADPHRCYGYASPLHIAVKTKNVAQILAFIEGGADLNYAKTKTALYIAVIDGTPGITKLLVQHGADPYQQGYHESSLNPHQRGYYESPLNIAVKIKNVVQVLAFIASGVNLNYANKKGQTTLHIAAAVFYNHEIIKLLLKHGADPYKLDHQQHSPISIAIEKSDQENVFAFLEGRLYSHEDGQAALRFAAEWGALKIIELLIQQGIDLNDANKEGQTALHIAVARDGNFKTIKLLLKHGADPYKLDHQGQSPIFLAVKRSARENVCAFLEGKCSYHGDCQEALHFAAKWGAIKIIELLIQHEVDLNYANEDGQTALHIAADKHFNTRAIKLLLKHGADPCKLDHQKQSPIFIAIKRSARENVFAFLEERSYSHEDGQAALRFAAEWGEHKIIELLIQHGIDLNYVNEKGQTALHLANYNFLNALTIIELLIKHGANPYHLDHSGKTPLFGAIESLKLKNVHAFIQAGIDLNYTDKDGVTALHKAAQFGTTEIIELLTKHGANPNLKDNEGRTPLDLLFNSDSCKDSSAGLGSA